MTLDSQQIRATTAVELACGQVYRLLYKAALSVEHCPLPSIYNLPGPRQLPDSQV